MISSMTKKERENPEIIDNSRRRRIAAGSGSKIDDVSRLVKQFIGVNEMSRRMAGLSAKDKVAAMKSMGGGAPGMPGGMPALRSKGSSHSTSIKDRFKKRKR
jgi:signal recognition particle subunit SRP54